MRATAKIAAMVLGLMATTSAVAQSDVVVMRRVVAPPTKRLTGSSPSYYSWKTSGWTQTGQCGQQGTETRTVSCVRTDGVTVDDSNCVGNGSGTRPADSQVVTVTQSCSYSWLTGDWDKTASTCGATAITRSVTCLRSDGAVTDPSLCSSVPQPPISETIVDYSGCAFTWAAGDWSAPSTMCGSATESRTVACQRSDGTTVSDASCANAGTKPNATQNITETTGCTAYWNIGNWGATAPACGASTQSRSVDCLSGSGAALPDSACIDAAGAKPATSRSANSTATCSYIWSPSAWNVPDGACGNVTETRTFSCVDSSGNPADASLCTQSQPSSTRTAHVMTGCTYSWATGDYGSPQPACGPTVATRSVTCTASDGESAAASSCDAASKPADTQAATDYSACTFAWTAGPWSDWSATCGDATETRLVACQRADGTAADDSSCQGTKPSTTQSSYQTTGCGYSWQPSTWSVVPACGPTTESRYVTCVRSDGQAADSAQCTSTVGAAPPTTGTTTDTSACTYSWAVADWSTPSSTCGQVTQTRAVTCQQSDATTVTDDKCAAAGTKPDSSQTVVLTTGCSYTWKSNPWSSPLPACGPSTETRTNYCQRSDGTTVDAANCTDAQPATTQQANDYSTCSYTWTVGQWSQAGVCGVSATQTRTVVCTRLSGSGDTVDDSLCVSNGQGAKPATSQTVTEYSGCSYTWKQVVGTWSSTCSTTATRSNTVTCQRSDGVTVDNSYCDAGTKPADTDTGNVSGCTFTGTYGNPTTCVPTSQGATTGTQTVSLTQCTRSDGTVVANAQCTPATQTQACTPAVTSTQYSRQPSSLVDPMTQPAAYRVPNLSSNSTFGLSVNGTLCWDSVNNGTSTASNCAALTSGANVYDIVGLPATYVSDLHEVYVNQSDITAAMPHATQLLATTVTSACTGASVTVSGQTWKFYCGTPDTAGHYSRQPQYLQDPYSLSGLPAASKTVNANTASTLTFAVRSTLCWDTTANALAASTSKCQYLTAGANVYDLYSISATYVTDLREVYITQADLQAAQPHSSIVYDSGNLPTTITNACSSGMAAEVYVGGVAQAWTMRCGAADNAAHYSRQASYLQDPSSLSNEPSASRTVNVSTGSTFSLAVRSTLCWDSTASASTSSSKCQYLPSGDNVYDLKTMPATYVAQTREIYVAQTDLQAAEPHGSTIFDSGGSTESISTVCAATGGAPITVYVGGTAQIWSLRCGTPDANTYYHYPVYLGDPYVFYSTTANRNVNNTSNPLLYVAVSQLGCWNVTANAVTSLNAKCNYVGGPALYDLAHVPATWNTTAKTVTVNTADLAGTFQYLQSSAYSSRVCGSSFNLSGTNYKVVCQ